MLSNHPNLRLGIYLVALALGVAGYFAGPLIGGDLGSAFQDASGYLMAAALGVAATARATNAPTADRGAPSGDLTPRPDSLRWPGA